MENNVSLRASSGWLGQLRPAQMNFLFILLFLAAAVFAPPVSQAQSLQPGVDWVKAVDAAQAPWATTYRLIPITLNGDLLLYEAFPPTSSTVARLWRQNSQGNWYATNTNTIYLHFLVEFGGKLLSLSDTASMAKRSTDGVTWSTLMDRVPWTGAINQAYVFQNKIHVIVRTLDGSKKEELWVSSTGTSWERVRESLPWVNRIYYPVAVFKNKVWMLGGASFTMTGDHGDVWSTSDGVNWTTTTMMAPWGPRACHGAVVFQDKLWVMGGNGRGNGGVLTNYTDVWNTGDGINWTRVTNSAPWAPRRMILPKINPVVYRNAMWIMGGLAAPFGSRPLRDVWHSPQPTDSIVFYPISSQTAREGFGFTGPIPKISGVQGVVTWSLVNPPRGLNINPSTGQVTWAKPVAAANAYTIVERATVGAAVKDLSWTLNVTPGGALTASLPPWFKGTSSYVQWSWTTAASSYTVQVADNANFTPTLRSVDVSTTSYFCSFDNMAGDKRYYYRVRYNRQSGLVPPWSNVVSALQDNTAPSGAIAQDTRYAPAPGRVWVSLAGVNDPGLNPSGLDRMRVLKPVQGAFEPFTALKIMDFAQAGANTVQIEVTDVVGFKTMFTTTVNVPSTGLMQVSGANTAGPWFGSPANPYKTIQSAIDAATTGTEIVVAAGRYYENLDFKGKSIILRSTNPLSEPVVKTTIIDGQARDAVIKLTGTETAACRIEGLTLTNGRGASGAISGHATKATIQHNRILNNTAYVFKFTSELVRSPYGGYISLLHYEHSGEGGGIGYCNGLIQNNIIAFNRAYGTSTATTGTMVVSNKYTFAGDALFACNGTVRNNTIYGNGAGKAVALDRCKGTLLNNIIWDNETSGTAQIIRCATPSYCDIQDWNAGGTGNLNADPRLVDPLHENFRLQLASPCIDAGGAAPGLATDMVGVPRGIIVYEGRGDGSHLDMGAYEYPIQAAAPSVYQKAGSYAPTLKIGMACATAGVTIRCTWTGGEPTEASPAYNPATGLTLRGTAGTKITVRAKAFKTGVIPSATTAVTFTLAPLPITQITRTGVVTDSLAAGKLIFTDRNYIFTGSIPSALQDQLYLRTLNGDKLGGVGLGFTAPVPVTVYVAMSEGFGSARPAWLADWAPMPWTLQSSEGVGRRIYRKYFGAGPVTLGPNREGAMPSGPSMYSVIVVSRY